MALIQIKDILPIMSDVDYVIIWQDDPYIDPARNDEAEKIFEGFIGGIPWTFINMYFTNSTLDGAIQIRDFGDEAKTAVHHGYVWIVVENPENVKGIEKI